MAAGSNEAVIVVKKVKKGGHDAHHGGAWKVAYADFVTAMMAFFLLLWLLNATTEEQKRGISDYFSPQAVSTSQSGAGGVLGGLTVSAPGAMQQRRAVPSVSFELKPTSGSDAGDGSEIGGDKDDINEQAAEQLLRKRDDEAFAKVQTEVHKAIHADPKLRDLEENLKIDKTPEGLRIQIVDQEGKPMFPLGSAEMLARTRQVIAKIATVIGPLPNAISISGHTDGTPFRGRKGYGNWELSSDRANASRRELINAGLDAKRIRQVIGKADTEPLVPDNPASPQNRRISIVLLHQTKDGKPAPTVVSKPKPAAPTKPPTDFQRNWTGPRLR